MSDKQKNVEQNKTLVISAEDCNAALDFWRHFNIPIPVDLQSALDTFAKEESFENQEKVKLEICKAISTVDHEAFKDDMFKKITEECESMTFQMQFDKDFEAEVTVKD